MRAQSADGRMRISLSTEMAQDAFERFCAASADEVCGDFEDYFIEVLVQENHVTLVFVHSDAQTLSGNTAGGFFCTYWDEEPVCGSGLHSYD